MTAEEIADEIETFCTGGSALFRFLVRYTNDGTDQFLHTATKPYPAYNMTIYAEKSRNGVKGVGGMRSFIRRGRFDRDSFLRSWFVPETTVQR